MFVLGQQVCVGVSALLSLLDRNYIDKYGLGLVSLDPQAEYSVAGAIIVWVVFVVYYFRRRRRRSNSSYERFHDTEEDNAFAPGTVLFLSFIGCIDELMYFPALLISGKFTAIRKSCKRSWLLRHSTHMFKQKLVPRRIRL